MPIPTHRKPADGLLSALAISPTMKGVVRLEDLFNPSVMLLYTVLVAFIVDMLPNAKSSFKVALSIVVSMLVVFATKSDVVASISGESSTNLTMMLSGLTLAAFTSKVAHPLKKLLEQKKGDGDGSV